MVAPNRGRTNQVNTWQAKLFGGAIEYFVDVKRNNHSNKMADSVSNL
jgi:hypothetical protein